MQLNRQLVITKKKFIIFVNNSVCENNWEIFVSLILSISDENGLCITEEKKQTNVRNMVAF